MKLEDLETQDSAQEKTVTLDEADVNPFETKSALVNSPPPSPPPAKGAYNLDFLDNLDDPNINPFQSKKAMSNSPPPAATGGYSIDADKFDDPNFNPFASKKAMLVFEDLVF